MFYRKGVIHRAWCNYAPKGVSHRSQMTLVKVKGTRTFYGSKLSKTRCSRPWRSTVPHTCVLGVHLGVAQLLRELLNLLVLGGEYLTQFGDHLGTAQQAGCGMREEGSVTPPLMTGLPQSLQLALAEDGPSCARNRPSAWRGMSGVCGPSAPASEGRWRPREQDGEPALSRGW